MKLYTLGATGTPPRITGFLFRPDDGFACLKVLLQHLAVRLPQHVSCGCIMLARKTPAQVMEPLTSGPC
jgi:hypothetical protein